jgi:uncharacterized zinc-type alcohol dehydrogenase-like protein
MFGNYFQKIQISNIAARQDIKPITKHFSFNQINDAMDHLRSGKARYRIVLDQN